MQNTPPRPLRLVLDTNVVLDLLHFVDAAAAPILHALQTRSAQCRTSAQTLEELRRVLAYPEFKINAEAQTTLLARYQGWTGPGEPVSVHANLPRCSDPDDQMFLELAASTQADFLITKDKALLRLKRYHGLGFSILTPAEADALLA